MLTWRKKAIVFDKFLDLKKKPENESTFARTAPFIFRVFLLSCLLAILSYLSEKKKAYTTPKENLLENFSGFKEKLSRPLVDTKPP